MHHHDESEHARYDECAVCQHDGEDDAECQSLAEIGIDDVLHHREMLLTLSAGKESDAKEECLLDDEHEYARQYEVAVAACGVEYRYFLEIEI